jgi:hypothetical protein
VVTAEDCLPVGTGCGGAGGGRIVAATSVT